VNISCDRLIGSFFVVFSAVFFSISLSYPFEAALFPRILLGFLFLGGLLFIIKPAENKGLRELFPRRLRQGTTIVGLTLVYFILINTAGFYSSTALYLFFLIRTWGVAKLKSTLATIVFYNLFIYILFDRFLHIMLPKGFLF